MEANIKEHIKKHKTIYLSVAVGAGVAGLTVLVMRGRHAGIQRVPDGRDIVTVRPLSFLSRQNVVTVIEREGRGHPGYVVRHIETGDVFLSQNEVADKMNTYPSIVSGHLNGKLPDIHGQHFERVTTT